MLKNKSLHIVILSLTLILFFSSCSQGDSAQQESNDSSNANYNVTLKTERETYKANTEEIMCTFYNNSDTAYIYGNSFTLEQKNGDSWKRIEPKDSTFFTLEGIILKANSNQAHTYSMNIFPETLTVGEYRISSKLNPYDPSDNSESNSDSFTVYAKFSIE